jgi:hypothetical protein
MQHTVQNTLSPGQGRSGIEHSPKDTKKITNVCCCTVAYSMFFFFVGHTPQQETTPAEGRSPEGLAALGLGSQTRPKTKISGVPARSTGLAGSEPTSP